MPKPRNLARHAARAQGQRFYTEQNPCWCGCNQHYTVNGTCVECAKTKAKDRYAALSEEDKAVLARQDRLRYEVRRTKLLEARRAD